MNLREQVESLLPAWERWYPSLFDAASDLGLIRAEVCQAGLVRKLPTTNGCCRYDAETTPHLHVRCVETGEIADVPEQLSDELIHGLPQDVLRRIEQEMNIKIDRVHMQIMARKP